ncbi:hypothetical protein VP1G_00587 [Cytospora mali]|uniref:Uncharacterized protein n=1 Tax=Cytospora mali TaxID=578113 RepID=A0A194UNQ1_CYTMA|nr:hypothetical protein VP1G_00587 [Valsa mali var. pyri (nom. inval.)]
MLPTERATPHLSNPLAAPSPVALAGMRRAITRRHEQADIPKSTSREQEAGAQRTVPAPAGEEEGVQAGDGVLAQLLARREGALVGRAVLQAVWPALAVVALVP